MLLYFNLLVSITFISVASAIKLDFTDCGKLWIFAFAFFPKYTQNWFLKTIALSQCVVYVLNTFLISVAIIAGKQEVIEIRSTTCEEDPCRVPIGGRVILEVDFVPSE